MVAVVLFHAGCAGVGGGFVGVDAFFVISGFLITGLLWREANTTGSVRLRRFYGARARRLLPTSATVGVITMVASACSTPTAGPTGDQRRHRQRAVCRQLLVHSATGPLLRRVQGARLPALLVVGRPGAVYLVWPAMIIGTAWLIRLARRTPRPRRPPRRPYLVVLALVAAVSFVLSLAVTYVAPFVAFFSLPTRAWQLAVGGLVALTAGQWRRLAPRTASLSGWAGC